MYTCSGSSIDKPSPWQVRFEDERVKMILVKFKLLDHIRAMLDDCAANDLTGERTRKLTFESLYRLFPSFPIRLGVSYHTRVAERCSPVSMFRSFDQLFFFTDYLAHNARHEAECQERPIGLIIPFDGFRGGMIVHNGTYDTRTTKMTHPIPGDQPPHRVTIEPFESLLKYLARGGWTPQSEFPDQMPIQQPQVPREITITSSMVQKFGAGPALLVFAWLHKVLSSDSGYDRHYIRRDKDGRRYVAATQEQIASETGLSERQVKRAMADLRRSDLIKTKAHKGRSCIWVLTDGRSM